LVERGGGPALERPRAAACNAHAMSAPLESSSAAVVLGPAYAERVRRFAAAFAAQRARASSASGAARRAGGGDELVGHRPLRAGEDARDLDVALYARLERPFVRERRAEAGERWVIALDTSRSMGVGAPSKLQLAAEVAGALAACALRCGARVEVCSPSRGGGVEFEVCARALDWARCARWLEARSAFAVGSSASLLAQPRLLAARRVFLLGDLFDLEPAQLLTLARRGRAVAALAVLAPLELAPPRSGSVVWRDLETQARAPVALSPEVVERYRAALEARLAAWAGAFARRGQTFAVASSASQFEDAVRGVLRA